MSRVLGYVSEIRGEHASCGRIVRKLDHRLAGRDLFARLVAHHDVDQDPARILRHLLGLDDAGWLDGVAGLHRLDPARFEPAVDGTNL